MLKNYNLHVLRRSKNIVIIDGTHINLCNYKKKTPMLKTGWMREALTLYFMQEEDMEFQLADSLACKITNNKDALTHYVVFGEIVIYEHIYKKALEEFKNWKERAKK